MKACARVLVTAATLAALSTLGLAVSAQAGVPPTDARAQGLAVAPEHPMVPHAGHAAQVDRAGPATAAASQPGTDHTARQQALAQERYYSTWRYADQAAAPPRPAEPSRKPGWLVASLAGLAAGLALSGGLAALAANRAGHKARLGQAT